MYIRLESSWNDLWIGARTKRNIIRNRSTKYEVWICLVPCLPIHIWWWGKNLYKVKRL